MAVLDRGTGSLSIEGVVVNLSADLTYSVTGETAEVQIGVDGHRSDMFTRKPKFIEATISNRGDFDTGTFSGLQNATVQINLRNGKIIALTNATQVGEVEVDAIAGTFTVRFESDEGEEILIN
jgi:hypothetical protein